MVHGCRTEQFQHSKGGWFSSCGGRGHVARRVQAGVHLRARAALAQAAHEQRGQRRARHARERCKHLRAALAGCLQCPLS